jgi:hypothetical protein|tara:strand:+ start:285 stop:620 length:336 start_codon:yes stop_codon:yes gene_type:complete
MLQGMQLEIISKKISQKQSCLTISMMGNVMQKQVVNKDKGYSEVQGQTIKLSGDELENALEESVIFAEINLDPSKIKVSISDLNGVAAYELAVSPNKSFFYDQETHLKLKF